MSLIASRALVHQRIAFQRASRPTPELASDVVLRVLDESGVASIAPARHVSMRYRGDVTFAFNFKSDSLTAHADVNAKYVLGAHSIGALNLSAWKT